MPDLALPLVDDGFDRVRAALQWWAQQDGTEPTSSLTGGGAIAQLESELGRRLGGWALALPSGSSAITTGLRVLAGCAHLSVALIGCEWFGAAGLVHAAGGTIADDCASATIALVDAEAALTSRHVYQSSHPPSTIVLDAANVTTDRYSELGRARWDALALSFGPGKPIDAGEGGALVVRDRERWLETLRTTQHPLRQQLVGVEPAIIDLVCQRMHPVAAVVALHHLAG